jgi:apolipoprotein N-acyltransferase
MNSISKKNRYLLSLLSGVLMVISFPYTGSLTPLVFISWIPLLLVESTISKNNYRSSKLYLHSLITFFIFNIGTTWWVWNASGIGASMAFILNTIFMALIFQFFHITKKYVGAKEGYLSLFFFWIAFEFIHYQWELSWPWLNLGNYFSITPSWVQWYSYTGILGGTFWILLINLIGFRIIENVWFRKESWRIQTPLIWSFFAVILVPLAISLTTYFTYQEKLDPMEIVVVQPNIDPYNEKFDDPVELQIQKLCDLAETKITTETELLIAPETAISQGFYEEDATYIPSLNYLIKKKNEWGLPSLLIGASTARVFKEKRSRASRRLEGGPGFVEYYNTSVMINNANDLTFVHKSLLVPGVEIIPFSNYLPFLEQLSIDNGGTTGSLGIEKEPQIMQTKNAIISSLICYESICGGMLADQCRKGAEAVFVITNDGWWGDTPGYKQHMSFSRLRAIESRRYVARSANTGTSCIINQRGDVLQQTSWWEPAVLKGTIHKNKELTFYSIYGDIMGRSFVFVSALLLLFTFVKYFKKKYMNS